MVAALHYSQLNNFAHDGIIIGDKLETSDIVFRNYRGTSPRPTSSNIGEANARETSLKTK